MGDGESAPMRARWARLRFSIIGSLLASPPEHGQLQERIEELAHKQWEHPTTGQPTTFSASSIARWYYKVSGDEPDPFGKLARKTRKDAGSHPTINVELGKAIAEQYRDHRTWQYMLHVDNLRVLAEERPELGSVPSYTTVTRYMKDRGLLKQKKKRKTRRAGAIEPREKRSWEVLYANQLWHLDFHVSSRKVLIAKGVWVRPWLLGILDDHSRLACHLQWYLTENAQNLIHGLIQAFQKRGLPRALLTDGGGAMKAGETRQGLRRSSVTHEMTLPETPEQNGKQECFWNQIEGRLLPMLEGVEDLTLRLLNEATQAWVEGEYNRETHSVTDESPIARFAITSVDHVPTPMYCGETIVSRPPARSGALTARSRSKANASSCLAATARCDGSLYDMRAGTCRTCTSSIHDGRRSCVPCIPSTASATRTRHDEPCSPAPTPTSSLPSNQLDAAGLHHCCANSSPTTQPPGFRPHTYPKTNAPPRSPTMNTSESNTIDLFEVPTLALASSQELLSWTLDDVPTDAVVAEPGTGKSAELSRFARQFDGYEAANDEVCP